MAEIYFEDEVIAVEEEVEPLGVEYKIEDNNLICIKTIKQTLTSKIYNYDDGVSAYLKFDGKFVNVMLAFYKTNSEKTAASVTSNANVYLKRIGNSFHILSEDDANGETVVDIITLREDLDISKTRLNFTKILEYKILNNQHCLIGGYEKLDDGAYLQTVSVLDVTGKTEQVFVDGQNKKLQNYSFNVAAKHGKAKVSVKGARKAPYEIPDVEEIQITDMLAR